MKRIKIIITSLLILFCSITYSQQKLDVKIDEIGNAKIQISMTMNAQQWQYWRANIGNNPAALKREIERSMPAYFLDDFNLTKDEMNRSFTLDLNAYGLCKINKRGKWIIETDQKNAQITELSDNKYMLVSNIQEGENVIQQTYILEFPNEAKSIEIEKDAYGETVFEFNMENSTAHFNFPKWMGIILLIVGAGMIALKFK